MIIIIEESYGKHPGRIRQCILSEVSVKISEEIVEGIPEAFLGTNSETITIGTLQDAHERIHEEDISGQVL